MTQPKEPSMAIQATKDVLTWSWRVLVVILIPLTGLYMSERRRADMAEIAIQREVVLGAYQKKDAFLEWEAKHKTYTEVVARENDSAHGALDRRIVGLEQDRVVLIEIQKAITRLETKLESFIQQQQGRSTTRNPSSNP